jgi:hypothetical protein
LVPAFAPLFFFQFAIALLRALERFGRAHGLTAVAQQFHQAADEDKRDESQCNEELDHRQKVTFTDSADLCAGPWNTTSMLLPSGSSTNAP